MIRANDDDLQAICDLQSNTIAFYNSRKSFQEFLLRLSVSNWKQCAECLLKLFTNDKRKSRLRVKVSCVYTWFFLYRSLQFRDFFSRERTDRIPLRGTRSRWCWPFADQRCYGAGKRRGVVSRGNDLWLRGPGRAPFSSTGLVLFFRHLSDDPSLFLSCPVTCGVNAFSVGLFAQ